MKKKIHDIINRYLSDESRDALEKMEKDLVNASSVKVGTSIDTISSVESADFIS